MPSSRPRSQPAGSSPRADLIGFLMDQTIDGKPLSEQHLLGTLRLLLLAGIDTTWSSISHTLLHLARTPEHRRRLVAEPALMPTAIEEFLRVLAPVSVARLVVKDQEVGGCRFAAGEMVLLPYPAANRDPEKFDRPDEVVLDRQENRHSTFGLGIHRCIGSNLARMELTVAIEEWLRRIPEFELEEGAELNWSRGLVRGPRSVPVRFSAGQDGLAPGLPPSREASCQPTVDHNVLAVEPANLAFRQHHDRLSDVVWLAHPADHGDVALHHVSAGHLLEIGEDRGVDRTGSHIVDANTAGEPAARQAAWCRALPPPWRRYRRRCLRRRPWPATRRGQKAKSEVGQQLGQSSAPLAPVVAGDAGDIDDPAIVRDPVPQAFGQVPQAQKIDAYRLLCADRARHAGNIEQSRDWLLDPRKGGVDRSGVRQITVRVPGDLGGGRLDVEREHSVPALDQPHRGGMTDA